MKLGKLYKIKKILDKFGKSDIGISFNCEDGIYIIPPESIILLTHKLQTNAKTEVKILYKGNVYHRNFIGNKFLNWFDEL